MNKENLTPWMSMADSPPARPGIYNVSCRASDQSGKWFSHFNGTHWGPWETINRAGNWKKLVLYVERYPHGITSERSFDGKATWRGLAYDPKVKP